MQQVKELPAGRQDNPPVHEKTKIGPDWRYGCWNHPSRNGNAYYAPNRVYLTDGRFVIELKKIESEWIEHDVCRAWHDHQGCQGCAHGGEHGV